MSFTAIVENGTIKLPMHVPDGTSVRITLPDERTGDRDAWLRRLAALRARATPGGASIQNVMDEIRAERFE